MNPKENIIENLSPKPINFGMTLIELLVVLGILAALAGMTLSFVSEYDSSNRQEITRNRLDQIESAIIGDTTNSGRFLNDMGRLPVTNKNTGEELNELWNNNLFEPASDLTINYTGYENNEITTPFNVTLNLGWKGPYLNVQRKLYDGFGNNLWICEEEDKNDVEDTEFWNILNLDDSSDPITILRFGSLGEDSSKDVDSSTSVSWQNIDDIREIKRSKVFSTLHVKIMLRDNSTDQTTWLPAAKTSGYTKYDNTTYDVGTIVLPPAADPNYDPKDLFIRISPPTYATSAVTAWTRSQIFKVDDNYFRWLPYSQKINRLRVAVFSPYVTKKSYTSTDENDGENENVKISTVRITTAYYNNDSTGWQFADELYKKDNNNLSGETLPEIDSESQTSISEVTFNNLVPGIRKIFVYGYVLSSENIKSNAYHSNIQTIELKNGENFITIYLSETL